ncbi:MAG: hypothetical protein WD845_17800 [Pirellulales bacterium]
MARKSNSHVTAALVPWALLLAALLAPARPLVACPFCTALGPTLAQRREQSEVAALAEVAATLDRGRTTLKLHAVLQGGDTFPAGQMLTAKLDVAAKPGTLLLVFGDAAGSARDTERSWHAVAANEISYAYLARSPDLKTPTLERLRYFAAYLEHPDPLVAEDAYLEFGHAPFDDVARMADTLSGQKLRRWLIDPGVPEARKGFYGLAVALAAPQSERASTADFLRQRIVAPENDFRAGFDGVLGGYLLLAGLPGLELIESRYLANANSADGDVRHALTALRFYAEYGREIPRSRLAQAVARLLARDEFAAEAITDLARWQAWEAQAEVVDVYARSASDERTRRAVVGYLLACPAAEARQALARLRVNDPAGVAAAEQVLSRTSGVRLDE